MKNMNTKKYSSAFKIMVIITGLLITANTYCQSSDASIVKTTTLGKNDVVYVRNPALDVDINTWDRNVLKIEYQLSVKAGSEEDIRDFYSAFQEALTRQFKDAGSGDVYANVQFSSYTRNNDKTKLKIKGDDHVYNLEKFDGSIVIYMPKSNSLNAKTSFHKLNIEDLGADATIDISSAGLTMGNCRKLDLKASFSKNMKIGKTESAKMSLNSSDVEMEAIESDLDLEANFSNIEIAGIGNKAELDLNSSSMETSDIGSLDLKGSFIRSFTANNIGIAGISINSSKFEAKKITTVNVGKITFSTLKIDETGNIDIGTSSSSKFYFESANSIKAASCSFSDFEIGNLSRLFTLVAQSGNVKLNNVGKGFDKIDINGTFLTTSIHVFPGSSYLISADMSFPDYDFGNINIKSHQKDMSHEKIEGWKGSDKSNSGINLNCQSCRITVD